MSDRRRPAEPEARRALLARLLAEEAERPLREPATPGQKRLWFATRQAPGSPLYNCPLTIEVEGELDPEAVASAIQALVARHEALRTRFEEEDGELYQVVAPRGSLDVERHAPEGARLEDRRSAARDFARRFARRSFDLMRGPLYRVALVSIASDEHLLLLNAHHIVSDGWSQGVVLREWLEAYRALVAGKPIELPPLPLRFTDAARWQRERESPLETIETWKRRLGDVEALKLPLDFPRPPLQTAAGARVPIQLSAEATRRARAVAEREGASLFQVVLTAFQVVLARWCRQERFVVGTPSHNRHRSELEGLVGFFVSTVPIVAQLEGDPTLGEALERTRRSTLEALAHPDVPFDRLVALAPSRGRAPGVPPLVQVLFVWQQEVLPELALPGARLRAREEPTGTSKFDFTLSLRPEADALVGHVELNTDLFGPESLARVTRQLEPVLEALDRRPEVPLSAALPTSEAFASAGPALASSSDTASAYARALEAHPGDPALWTDERTLTFGELDAAASALAARLRAEGHRDEQPLALRLGASPEAIVGIVAAWKCASPYVPLDPGWPAERVRRILEETGTRLCLGAFDGPPVEGALTLPVELDALLREEAPRDGAGRLAARPADLAYIIYTSGSTGAPKGVLVPHRALAHLDGALDATVYGSRPGGGRRIGVFGSLAFDTTVKQIVRLLRGDCLCPIPTELKTSPARLASYLDGAALDAIDVTPSWIRVLFDAGIAPHPDRTFLLGGEPIDPALWHELALRQARGEARFINLYGPTEATVDATWAELDPECEPSIGRPLPGTNVWLLDEQGRPVPPGFVGEIAIGGGGVAVGYLDRPDATAASFVELPVAGKTERIYRTGDFARLRHNDAIVFLGRRDRQLKRHGQRIELDEIEAALRVHPEVAEAAVVESAGRLVAWTARRAETPGDLDLAAHAARILPPGFLPDAFREIASLPKTTSGKIDYVALAALASECEPEPAPPSPSHDASAHPYVEAVSEIWAELLGAPPASPQADFFAAGGDSLLGLRLLARVEKRFGVALDVSLLAARPTPESLAAVLGGRASWEGERLVRLQRGEGAPRRPLVLVHPTSGEVGCYRELVALLDPRLSVLGVPAPPEVPEELSKLAEEYAVALLDATPGNELLVGGWSLGGVLALEVARELRRQGVAVPLVLLFDARLPSASRSHESRLAPELATEEVGRRLAERSERLLALWERHAPEPYDGDVLLVRAGASGSADAEVHRWREILPRLAVVRAAVEHDTMMRAPDVSKVAQVVSRSLQGVSP